MSICSFVSAYGCATFLRVGLLKMGLLHAEDEMLCHQAHHGIEFGEHE